MLACRVNQIIAVTKKRHPGLDPGSSHEFTDMDWIPTAVGGGITPFDKLRMIIIGNYVEPVET